jgi:hypothetical protein
MYKIGGITPLPVATAAATPTTGSVPAPVIESDFKLVAEASIIRAPFFSR